MDSPDAYANARHRISGLLRDRGLAVADRRVPACPHWTIREITAHLVGVTEDALNGNLADAGTDPWTAVHVDKRRHQRLEQILDEWDETGPRLDKAIAGAGDAVNQLVFDTATHEHDLRGALDASGAHDADSTHIALGWVSSAWSEHFVEHGFEPLRIVSDDLTVEAGEGEPVANLKMARFEALRALSGRRSVRQLAAYDWDADPTLWLPAFTWGPFTPPTQDLVE